MRTYRFRFAGNPTNPGGIKAGPSRDSVFSSLAPDESEVEVDEEAPEPDEPEVEVDEEAPEPVALESPTPPVLEPLESVAALVESAADELA